MKAGSSIQEISPQRRFLQTIGATVTRPVIIYLEGEQPHETTKLSTEHTGKLFLSLLRLAILEDMTFRAVNTLRDVDLISAEDTRHTQKLLNHFEIETLKSFHEHNTQERILKPSSGCKKEKASRSE